MSQVLSSSHPKGLYTLFFAEMWERFSYYGMRAILIFYMTSQLLFHDSKAYEIYAAYGVMLYSSQIIGGYLADHFLGATRAIYLGGIIITLGHLIMSLGGEIFMFFGLSFIILGTGFFKPNISALVGALYQKNDPRRDSGFTIFYMGINIGAFAAPLICGYVGERFGWHYGFGIASFGMLIGLVAFHQGQKFLEGLGQPKELKKLEKKVFLGLSTQTVLIGISLLSIPGFAYILTHHENTAYLLNTIGVIVLFYILYLAFFQCNPEERKCMLTILVTLPFTMSFFAAFEQCGSSMNLFANRNVQRVFMGWEIPASWFQSLNPIFIILLGPLFSALWIQLGKKKADPSTPVKFSLGLLQVGLGFAALLFGILNASPTGEVAMIWLVLAYLFHTTGELCISPVGLSMVTKLAPSRFVGLMMGSYFLSVAFSHHVAGLIAKVSSTPDGCLLDTDKVLALQNYMEAFKLALYFSTTMGITILFLAPFLKGVFARHR